MFQLDPAFDTSSHSVGDLPLCHVRLHDDARYPWLVLIPRVASAVELEDLSAEQRAALLEEVLHAGAAVRRIGEALALPVDKLNVGQLGNVTRQLHVHVVGRRPGDPAWPGPVWGHSPAQRFEPDALSVGLALAKRALGL